MRGIYFLFWVGGAFFPLFSLEGKFEKNIFLDYDPNWDSIACTVYSSVCLIQCDRDLFWCFEISFLCSALVDITIMWLIQGFVNT